MALKRQWRGGVDKFWNVLDAQIVGPFQVIVYVHIIAGGLYGLLIAGGTPQAVDDSMSDFDNQLWLYLCPAAALCLIGKACRGDLLYAGAILQLVGDLAAFGATVIYNVAVFDTSYWGQPLFAVFILVAIAECVALLIVRDIRRLYRAERRVRSWKE